MDGSMADNLIQYNPIQSNREGRKEVEHSCAVRIVQCGWGGSERVSEWAR